MTRDQLGASLNLSVDLIPTSNANRPQTTISPGFLTVHDTANRARGADAKAHAKYLINSEGIPEPGAKPTSWHYTVDDTRVVKHLPLNEMGWHAYNSGNGVSIGIEMCVNKDGDPAATADRTARLLAVLMFDLSKDTSAIVDHHHWPRSDGTRKNCPRRLRANSDGINWNDLISAAKDYLEQIDTTTAARSTEVEPGATAAAAAAVAAAAPIQPGGTPGDDNDWDHQAIAIPEEYLSPARELP